MTFAERKAIIVLAYDYRLSIEHIYIAMFLNIHTIRVYGHVHY